MQAKFSSIPLNSRLFILSLFYLVFMAQCLYSISQSSMAADEPKHLMSGIMYLEKGDLSFGKDIMMTGPSKADW